MELMDYELARDRSKGLFNNALVLPVALAVEEGAKVGSDFTVADVRRWIGGRAAENQIHDVLGRIESAEAITQMPFLGRPHPRRWERVAHPLWAFVTAWAEVAVKN